MGGDDLMKTSMIYKLLLPIRHLLTHLYLISVGLLVTISQGINALGSLIKPFNKSKTLTNPRALLDTAMLGHLYKTIVLVSFEQKMF